MLEERQLFNFLKILKQSRHQDYLWLNHSVFLRTINLHIILYTTHQYTVHKCSFKSSHALKVDTTPEIILLQEKNKIQPKVKRTMTPDYKCQIQKSTKVNKETFDDRKSQDYDLPRGGSLYASYRWLPGPPKPAWLSGPQQWVPGCLQCIHAQKNPWRNQEWWRHVLFFLTFFLGIV